MFEELIDFFIRRQDELPKMFALLSMPLIFALLLLVSTTTTAKWMEATNPKQQAEE